MELLENEDKQDEEQRENEGHRLTSSGGQSTRIFNMEELKKARILEARIRETVEESLGELQSAKYRGTRHHIHNENGNRGSENNDKRNSCMLHWSGKSIRQGNKTEDVGVLGSKSLNGGVYLPAAYQALLLLFGCLIQLAIGVQWLLDAPLQVVHIGGVVPRHRLLMPVNDVGPDTPSTTTSVTLCSTSFTHMLYSLCYVVFLIGTFANRLERLTADLNDACTASEGPDASKIIQSLKSKSCLKAFQEGLLELVKIIIKASRFNTFNEAVESAIENYTIEF
ncbi:hypothetical protein CBL_20090 [Carabus blaptoides fortunei]